MATIKRTRIWLTYLLALLVTAAFGFFGRTPPAWAEDSQRSHSASVFQGEMQQVAQKKADMDKYEAKPGIANVHEQELSQVDPVVRDKLRENAREIQLLKEQIRALQKEIEELKQERRQRR